MTFWGWGSSNRQSAVTWREGFG